MNTISISISGISISHPAMTLRVEIPDLLCGA
jgi:hypothetical protein